jgi:Fe-S-cluster containining protein
MDSNSIFLTIDEAIDAINIDFRQYSPQIPLFCSISHLISGNDIRFQREAGKEGVWINQRGRTNMRWLEGAELVEYMCARIRRTHWTIELLAAACRRVFQSRAMRAVDPQTGCEGLEIQTQMDAFECRQCGNCCRSLDYRHEIRAGDVEKWRSLGRDDILRWVETVPRNNEIAGYRVWVVPGTRRLAATCPFLKKEPATNRWGCAIHDAKPLICRSYPVSRKHAVMTGCRGFEHPQRDRSNYLKGRNAS